MLVEAGNKDEEPQTASRCLILQGSLGDLEMHWREENDEKVHAFIQEMMDKGVTFFEIEPVFFIFKRRTKVESVDALRGRSVFVGDDDIGKLVAGGAVEVTRRTSMFKQTGRVIRDAAEVARSSTIGTRQLQGG